MLSLFIAQLSDWNNCYLNIDTKDISCNTAILNNIIIINYTMAVGLINSERCFSLGIPVSSTNKTDHHDIAEILLKVALNTITLTLLRTTLYHQV
jgi:hypothetical protein